MDNKELEQMMAAEADRQEMEAMLDAKVNEPISDDLPKENIIDIESNLREKEMAKDLDVEAMNRNIYADMESRMNQPSPLYDDDDEMSKMLDRSNLDEVSSKEDKERGPRGL